MGMLVTRPTTTESEILRSFPEETASKSQMRLSVLQGQKQRTGDSLVTPVNSRRQSSPTMSVPDNGKQVEAKRRTSTSTLGGNGRESSTDGRKNETETAQIVPVDGHSLEVTSSGNEDADPNRNQLSKKNSSLQQSARGSTEIAGAVQTSVAHSISSNGTSSQMEMKDTSERASTHSPSSEQTVAPNETPTGGDGQRLSGGGAGAKE